MPPTRSSRLLLLGLALFAMACAGTGPKATYVNQKYSFDLFALTGAPANAPTAISFLGGPTVASAAFGFDVAVDIDTAGATRIYPVRSLAGGLAGTVKRIGFQTVPATSFEALREAPSTGYDTVGSRVVTQGAVLAFEIQDAATCLYSLGGTNLYAKMVIDSIKPTQRRIFGRTVVDPNCGFREIMPDTIPSR